MNADEEADYVIIGAGSGGCAAAHVLGLQTGARICVVESGGTNDRPDVRDPARWPELLTSDATWRYSTEPQHGTAERSHAWVMGRVLGGSSSINGMKYMRGAPWDYDAWAARGNPGWSANDVYEVFRQIERYPNGDEAIRGRSGPLHLEQVRGEHPLTAAFMRACTEAGFRRLADVNSLDSEGVGLNQLNVSDGTRGDAATALLGTVANKIRLRMHTSAVELCFDRSGVRVTGVRCTSPEGSRLIRVRREVIVAAGAIETPHLLMLSGVGAPAELEAVGVRPLVDVPAVGRNLHDHIGAPIVYEASKPVPRSVYQGTEATLYLRSAADSDHFDAQVSMQLFPAKLPDGYPVPADGFSMFPGILKPLSRGSIRLRSSQADVPPAIDPSYLVEPRDLTRLCEVVRIARELASSRQFDDWRAGEVGPGRRVTTEADLAAYVRRVAATYYHPVGTCQMGPDASNSVVDARLKVHGLANVRIADNSIMPEIVSGNTNAPAMMIGWRAGEFAAQDAESS